MYFASDDELRVEKYCIYLRSRNCLIATKIYFPTRAPASRFCRYSRFRLAITAHLPKFWDLCFWKICWDANTMEYNEWIFANGSMSMFKLLRTIRRPRCQLFFRIFNLQHKVVSNEHCPNLLAEENGDSNPKDENMNWRLVSRHVFMP